MSENMEWTSEQLEERRKKKETNKPSIRKSKAINKSLKPEEMKKILFDLDAKLEEEIHPVIIKIMPPGNSRFYVIRSLNMADMDKVESYFTLLYENRLDAIKTNARKEWFKDNDKNENDALTDVESQKLEETITNKLNLKREPLLRVTNDAAINIVGVVWPENHKEKVSNDKIPGGDLSTLAASVQVLSGWSQVESDIDVYEEALLSEDYDESSLDDIPLNES